MTDDENDWLTRRQVLGSAGTIGSAAALGGAGSMAFFSDREEFANNELVAGTLDLKLAWRENYFGEAAEAALGSYGPGGFFTAEEATLEMFPDVANGASVGFEDLDEGGCANAELYADAPQDLDPTMADSLRSNNDDTYDSAAGRAKPLISLQDVKPGDFGFTRFRLLLCDNPAYIWQTGGIRSLADNGMTEPEYRDTDQPVGAQDDGDGQLAEEVRVRLFQDRTGVAVTNLLSGLDGSSGMAFSQAVFEAFDLANAVTLQEFGDLLGTGSGIPLHGNPFDGNGGDLGQLLNDDLFLYDLPQPGAQQADRECFDAGGGAGQVGIIWGLPVDHANEIQSDSVAVDVGFYVEQCRHNDGSGLGNDDT